MCSFIFKGTSTLWGPQQACQPRQSLLWRNVLQSHTWNPFHGQFLGKDRVKQGCLSSFHFLLAIDWLIKTTTKITRQALTWNPQGKRKAKEFHETRPHNRHRGSGVHMGRDREMAQDRRHWRRKWGYIWGEIERWPRIGDVGGGSGGTYGER